MTIARRAPAYTLSLSRLFARHTHAPIKHICGVANIHIYSLFLYVATNGERNEGDTCRIVWYDVMGIAVAVFLDLLRTNKKK